MMIYVKAGFGAMLGILTIQAVSQLHDAPQLLQSLQNPATSNAALVDVREKARGDASFRDLVAARLPKLLTENQSPQVLANDSRLAGELKVTACIPQLLALFLKGDQEGFVVLLGRTARLENDPAGHALVQIGHAAIPSVKKLLSSTQSDVRSHAISVLVNIGTPAAMSTLREHRPLEADKRLQHVIDAHEAASQVERPQPQSP